jgi:hypothetical protein
MYSIDEIVAEIVTLTPAEARLTISQLDAENISPQARLILHKLLAAYVASFSSHVYPFEGS